MDKCPIEQMEITFKTVIDSESSLFEPVPARKIKPEWYKKLPVKVVNHGDEIATIKKCPAMHDWLSMGYLVRNRHSIYVWIGTNHNTKDGTPEPASITVPLREEVTQEDIQKMGTFKNPDEFVNYVMNGRFAHQEWEELTKKAPLGGHPAMQVEGMSRDDRMAFKFKMDFLIETPKGTSCYYLDPFLFDNPYFTVWQGIIDTDTFNQPTTNNMLIMYPKVDHSFIITKGTPLVQIVPFVRYPWKMKVEKYPKEQLMRDYDEELEKGDLGLLNTREDTGESNIYRKNWASRKEYS